jgi:hypothetical protein
MQTVVVKLMADLDSAILNLHCRMSAPVPNKLLRTVSHIAITFLGSAFLVLQGLYLFVEEWNYDNSKSSPVPFNPRMAT